ncbi:RNA polymerase sigma-70 factor [Flexithrix dorotheae]|uniref:RNA polymerase sigma-70 factor n=1 Tax=Flexithrix dorotheae TaxID=70993 RepID=UPI00037983CE|nr:RNA polymerase sigma-70 factor [Flexithrix dorotheae]
MELKNNLSDLNLIKAIKNENEQGLEQLFEKYYQPLCEFSEIIVTNSDLAEEIVSDLFLELWTKRKTIQIETGVKSYLFVAVKNKSINYLKQHRKISFIDLEGGEHKIQVENEAESMLGCTELNLAINKLLNTMPAQRRLIFRMNRIEGFKYKEIAEILSISVHTVQNQMVKANKFLIEKSYLLLKQMVLFPVLLLGLI